MVHLVIKMSSTCVEDVSVFALFTNFVLTENEEMGEICIFLVIFQKVLCSTNFQRDYLYMGYIYITHLYPLFGSRKLRKQFSGSSEK